ncbi:carbohydrate ABC transporter permease [Dactylosporangium sp. NPDC048998]|uniref:carbohydrate ABC transporter permease n=1 Tax=Dactylosporangium sp. NPDC048998 TaxID=3363976 RepID=UPI00371E5825
MLIVNAYPVIFAASQSLHGGSLVETGPFVGLQNFSQVLSDPAFWAAARFTLVFAVCGVFGSWVVGYGLALLLRPKFPGRSLFRVLLLLPWIVPIVVTSMSWNWLTTGQDSLLPTIARELGFGEVLFLADPVLAAVTVCLFKIWVSYPFTMMMATSALEGVDETVYEAAAIDGATRWNRLRYMTLPLTARSTYITWVLMAMFTINDFPTIYLLTGGGPVNATTSLIVLAYQSVFRDFQPGYGVAVAFIATAVLVVVSLVLFRKIRGSRVE